MANPKLCPVCGTELVETGSQGIVDYDGNWDAQSVRYICWKGKHTLFLVETIYITEDPNLDGEFDDDDEISPAMDAALDEVERALDHMEFVAPGPGVDGYACLPPWAGSKLDVYVKSLEDLRNELAKRAVATFKDFISKDISDEDYEYLEALEDVDDALVRRRKFLEELKWLPKA